MADGTVYDRGHFQKREDCCGMDGAVPISGKTLRKSCQSVFTSSGACAISGVCKNRKGVVVCRHCGSFCNQAAKNSRFCAILSLPIKRTIGWLAVTTACTGTLGFFRCASRTASLWGWEACTGRLSRITRFTPRACNPRLSRCSSSPLSKNTDDELLRHR